MVQSAFKTLDFSEQAVNSIWKLVAVILHLGNIEFDSIESNGENVAALANEKEVISVANLLEVTREDLRQTLLTRVIAAHSEVNSL